MLGPMLFMTLVLAALIVYSAVCLPVVSNSTEDACCFVSGVMYLHSQQIKRDDHSEVCLCLGGKMFCWWQQVSSQGRAIRRHTTAHYNNSVEDWSGEGGMWDYGGEVNWTEKKVKSDSPSTCTVMGVEYKVGEELPRETGTCLQCACGPLARVTCSPKDCAPQDTLHSLDQQSLDMFDVDLF